MKLFAFMAYHFVCTMLLRFYDELIANNVDEKYYAKNSASKRLSMPHVSSENDNSLS